MAARTPHAKNHGDLAAAAARYVKAGNFSFQGLTRCGCTL